jgi:sugar phosphate isomerase/epimerase
MNAKIGIRGHDLMTLRSFEKVSFDTFLDIYKQSNFKYIQLVLNKTFTDINIDTPFLYENYLSSINITLLGAYFNPVHPDLVKRQNGVDNFVKNLELASKIGCYVGTETGSLNGDKWTFTQKNKHKETRLTLINTLLPVVKIAVQNSNKILLEGAYNHVCFNPVKLKEVGDALDIDGNTIFYILDLYNYLHIKNYRKYIDILKQCLQVLGSKIKVFHLKDFIIENNKLVQVPLGEGLFDFNAIFDVVFESKLDLYFIFEGVVERDINPSYKFITDIITKKENK